MICVPGIWRRLVARVVRDDEVAGSNPVIPTNNKCEGPSSMSWVLRSFCDGLLTAGALLQWHGQVFRIGAAMYFVVVIANEL